MRFGGRVDFHGCVDCSHRRSGDAVFAQRTTATFGGVVEDETHAVLPGIQVRLVNEGTSVVLEQLTNERGEFLFDFVPVATYTLKLEMLGFKNLENRNISLGAAQTLRRTYTLQVGRCHRRSHSDCRSGAGQHRVARAALGAEYAAGHIPCR